MPLFNPIEGSVILRTHGQYQTHSLAECEGTIFAKLKDKYVRLKNGGNTSVTGCYWGPIELDQPKIYDVATGNMTLVSTQRKAA